MLACPSQSMRGVLGNEPISVEAPTTRRMTARQFIGIGDGNLFAAVTATQPSRSAAPVRRSTEYDQPSEALTRQVDKGRHVGIVSQFTRSEL